MSEDGVVADEGVGVKASWRQGGHLTSYLRLNSAGKSKILKRKVIC